MPITFSVCVSYSLPTAFVARAISLSLSRSSLICWSLSMLWPWFLILCCFLRRIIKDKRRFGYSFFCLRLRLCFDLERDLAHNLALGKHVERGYIVFEREGLGDDRLKFTLLVETKKLCEIIFIGGRFFFTEAA